MAYTKKVQKYTYTEVVIFDDEGNFVCSVTNNDETLDDTLSVEEITEEEAEEYL